MFYLSIRLIGTYSFDDNILLYASLFMVTFIALFNWVRKRAKRSKLNEDRLNIEESSNLEGYTFAFETETSSFDETIPAKKLTIGRKIVMFSMALVVAVTPLYELIGTLKEDVFYYGFCCLCW